MREQAYKSHVEAYIEAGLLELSVMDWMEILLTVDIKDLFDPLGMGQIGSIIEHILDYYDTNSEKLRADAKDVCDNIGLIFDRIGLYLYEQITTKSGENITEEDVINLILQPLIDYYEIHCPDFELPTN